MDYHHGKGILVKYSIQSAELCQQECQKEFRCKMFSWVTDAHHAVNYRQNCYLKSADMDRSRMIEHKGVMIGPRNCGKYYLAV